MIHLKATCDRRRIKKDGTNPIVFRITVDGKTRDISTGLSCHERFWDFKKSVVKDKSEELVILGKRIKDSELKFMEQIRTFENECPFIPDVQTLKDFLCNKKPKDFTVKEFWLEEAERLHRASKHSNARHYENILKRLEKRASFNISFQSINFSWLTELETGLREDGLNTNSVSVYFRALRSIYNKAVNQELVDYSFYPFRRFRIKNGSSTPRTLTLDEMRKFFRFEPTNDKLKQAHDFGKLIFCLRGINFTDLAILTKDNVKNGSLVFHRSKTHKLYSIKILPIVEKILDTYKSDIQNLLLSILSEAEYTDKKKLPEHICQRRKVLNKWLKMIGFVLNIEEELSTYVFRYSHANICRELGYSKDLISQSLGHSYGLRVTEAYLNDYNMKIIDEMNEHVVNAVM